jgi:hypothetical protein
MNRAPRQILSTTLIAILFIGAFPLVATATAKPSAATIEKIMLKALQSKSAIQIKFVSKQAGQTLSGVQWASPTQALQSTTYLNQTNHIMMIGSRLWINDNGPGLQAMFNATKAQATRWQNVWISVPTTNSNYRYIVSGLKGKSFFSSFLPHGKVRVVGPTASKNGPVFTLIGKTSQGSALGAFPMAVVVSAKSPYLPIGTLINATVNGQKLNSILKVTGFNTKAPVTIVAPSSAVAYALTGMPK